MLQRQLSRVFWNYLILIKPLVPTYLQLVGISRIFISVTWIQVKLVTSPLPTSQLGKYRNFSQSEGTISLAQLFQDHDLLGHSRWPWCKLQVLISDPAKGQIWGRHPRPGGVFDVRQDSPCSAHAQPIFSPYSRHLRTSWNLHTTCARTPALHTSRN